MGSAERQGKLWGAAVADWAELNEPHHEAYWRAMLEDLGVGDGTVFLDAGCGAGGGAKLALAAGATVYGLDASEAMIAYAREQYLAADFRVGELEALPYDDAFFDAVLAANAVQYCDDPQAALTELRRVCKPGGRIAVCTWDVREKNEQRFLGEAIARLLPEPPKPGAGPFALAEAGKLEAFVEGAGLRVVSGARVPVVYVFPDLDSFVRVQKSSGPNQAAVAAAGEEGFARAMAEFFDARKGGDGALRVHNQFRFVTAVPA